MLFIITEHTTCNVCEEEMRGGGTGGQTGQGWKVISLLLFLLVLLIHSQDHHKFSEESNEI